MAQLLCKTRGNTTAQGKPRVYFTCHEQDWEPYFETVTEEILRHSDCAVYYYEPNLELDAEDLEDLDQMQLFVIPVTSQLLFTPNRVLESELPVARQRHIPVLPLMQEPELDDAYSRVFGNLQYLCKIDEDPTALPYEEKLQKYLQSVLIDETLAQKIRAAFDAYIFLSYRKKDRKYAQELMRLIHKIPFCRDMAIWYDEFLNPGEDFNDAIATALEKSDLFVLTVTPNLVNEQNYIQEIEYPMAVAANKNVLPVQMIPTDTDALRTTYQNIPQQVDPADEECFTQSLKEALHAVALREKDSPEHDFFIGLAYFSGIDVEVDRVRAIKLITDAAEAGLTEAMQKLAQMYSTGDGVEQDEHASIHWREKLLQKAKEQYVATGSVEDEQAYLDALFEMALSYGSLGEQEKAVQGWQNLYDAAGNAYENRPTWRNQLYIGIGNRRLARVYYIDNSDYSKADEYLRKAKEAFENVAKDGKPMDYNLAVVCVDLGKNACWAKDYTAAEKWFLQAQERFEKMAESNTAADLSALADFYEQMGNYGRTVKPSKGISKLQWLQKAMKIRQSLAQSGTQWDLQKLAGIYETIAEKYRLEEKRKWYIKALEIREALPNDNHRAQYQLMKLYWKLGNKEKTLEIAAKLEKTGVTTYLNSIVDVYWDLFDEEYDKYFERWDYSAEEMLPAEKEPTLHWEQKCLELLDKMAAEDLYKAEEHLADRYISLMRRFADKKIFNKAIEYAMQAIRIMEKLAEQGDSQMQWKLLEAYRECAQTCTSSQQRAFTDSIWEKAFRLAEKLGEPQTSSEMDVVADVYSRIGIRDADVEKLRKAYRLYKVLEGNTPLPLFYPWVEKEIRKLGEEP